MSSDIATIEGDTIYSTDRSTRVRIDAEFDIWNDEDVQIEVEHLEAGDWIPVLYFLSWSASRGLEADLWDFHKEADPNPDLQTEVRLLLFVEEHARELLSATRSAEPAWRTAARSAGWNAPWVNGIDGEAPPELVPWVLEALHHGWRPDHNVDQQTLDMPRNTDENSAPDRQTGAAVPPGGTEAP